MLAISSSSTCTQLLFWHISPDDLVLFIIVVVYYLMRAICLITREYLTHFMSSFSSAILVPLPNQSQGKCFGWGTNVFTIAGTSLVLELERVLPCVLPWRVFMCTCGMCPVEVGAPVDSRARLQCRPGPSCLPSGPPEPQLWRNTSTYRQNTLTDAQANTQNRQL